MGRPSFCAMRPGCFLLSWTREKEQALSTSDLKQKFLDLLHSKISAVGTGWLRCGDLFVSCADGVVLSWTITSFIPVQRFSHSRVLDMNPSGANSPQTPNVHIPHSTKGAIASSASSSSHNHSSLLIHTSNISHHPSSTPPVDLHDILELDGSSAEEAESPVSILSASWVLSDLQRPSTTATVDSRETALCIPQLWPSLWDVLDFIPLSDCDVWLCPSGIVGRLNVRFTDLYQKLAGQIQLPKTCQQYCEWVQNVPTVNAHGFDSIAMITVLDQTFPYPTRLLLKARATATIPFAPSTSFLLDLHRLQAWFSCINLPSIVTVSKISTFAPLLSPPYASSSNNRHGQRGNAPKLKPAIQKSRKRARSEAVIVTDAVAPTLTGPNFSGTMLDSTPWQCQSDVDMLVRASLVHGHLLAQVQVDRDEPGSANAVALSPAHFMSPRTSITAGSIHMNSATPWPTATPNTPAVIQSPRSRSTVKRIRNVPSLLNISQKQRTSLKEQSPVSNNIEKQIVSQETSQTEISSQKANNWDGLGDLRSHEVTEDDFSFFDDGPKFNRTRPMPAVASERRSNAPEQAVTGLLDLPMTPPMLSQGLQLTMSNPPSLVADSSGPQWPNVSKHAHQIYSGVDNLHILDRMYKPGGRLAYLPPSKSRFSSAATDDNSLLCQACQLGCKEDLGRISTSISSMDNGVAVCKQCQHTFQTTDLKARQLPIREETSSAEDENCLSSSSSEEEDNLLLFSSEALAASVHNVLNTSPDLSVVTEMMKKFHPLWSPTFVPKEGVVPLSLVTKHSFQSWFGGSVTDTVRTFQIPSPSTEEKGNHEKILAPPSSQLISKGRLMFYKMAGEMAYPYETPTYAPKNVQNRLPNEWYSVNAMWLHDLLLRSYYCNSSGTQQWVGMTIPFSPGRYVVDQIHSWMAGFGMDLRGPLRLDELADAIGSENTEKSSKYGKFQIRRKKVEAHPVCFELLNAPKIRVKHEGRTLRILPSALRFWEKLGLEPWGGPKDVLYVAILPDGGPEWTYKVGQFFVQLNATYEQIKDGLLPVEFPNTMDLGQSARVQSSTLEAFRKPIGQLLTQVFSRICHSEKQHVCVYFIDPFQYPQSAVVLSSWFSDLVEHIFGSLLRSKNSKHLQFAVRDRIQFTIIPMHHISDLAFQVYEKIRDRHERNISNQVIETWPTPVDLDSRTSRTFFAPAFLLDDHDNLPEDFSFNRMLTTYSALVKITNSGSHENLLHAAYVVSPDGKHIVLSITDSIGLLKTYYVIPMQCQLILTCAAIWQYIALHLHHTTHSWRVVIVKAGPYDRKEMETWKHWLNADGHVIADMAQNADTIERYGNLVSITMMAALPSSYPGLFQATELPCDLKGQMDNGERLVEDVQTFMGLSPVSIPIWDGQDWDTPSYRGSLISRFSCNGSDSMVQEYVLMMHQQRPSLEEGTRFIHWGSQMEPNYRGIMYDILKQYHSLSYRNRTPGTLTHYRPRSDWYRPVTVMPFHLQHAIQLSWWSLVVEEEEVHDGLVDGG